VHIEYPLWRVARMKGRTSAGPIENDCSAAGSIRPANVL
jgi:hypothetical protein